MGRQGKPVVALSLEEEAIAAVDAYQFARGLQTRSVALRELVLFALGMDNPTSILDVMLPPGLPRAQQAVEARDEMLKTVR